jgi:IS30 family transposase
VPGHREGDLILGGHGTSAIGTPVERRTRDAVITTTGGLPAALRRSLTWDQGGEMARHAEIGSALDLPIRSCDPHSPLPR